MNKKHFLIIPLIGIMVGISYLSYSFINHAQAAGFTVNSLLDTSDVALGDSICDDGAGNCTLRAAIEEVNTLGGSGHTIDFNVTGTISTSGLLNITAGVTIDATTVPGASCDFATRNLPVIIDGGISSIFQINTSDVTIKGLTLQTGNGGIGSIGGNNISVLCNNIGTDATGLNNSSTAGTTGISFQSVTNSTIGQAGMGNIIGNQHNRPIFLDNGSDTISIIGNHIGVNALGNASLANFTSSGINIANSSNITIGAAGAGNENVISGFDGDINSSEGVVIYHSDTITIKNNYIGTDSTGTVAIPNGQQGIEVCGPISCGGGHGVTTNLVIGGSNPGEGNVISGNTGAGITLNGVQGFVLKGNKIGTTTSGLAALPNGNDGINAQGGNNFTIIKNTIQNNVNNGISFSNVTTASLSENIISGNDQGISIDLSNGVTITKNIVGFLADGITAAGNISFGILITQSDGIHIGSSNNTDRNYIGNNGNGPGIAGIALANTGTDISVIKNNIGVGIDNITAGPNNIGILGINAGSGNTLIQENRIANSVLDGIVIENSLAGGPIPVTSGIFSLIKNSIFNNGGLGINLGTDLRR
jgi:CSLREA domain-containing protein